MIKDILKNYKSSFLDKFTNSISFALVLLVSLTIIYFLPILILFVPALLLLPGFYAFQTTNTFINNKAKYSFGNYFKAFLLYFSQGGGTIYRSIMSTLKAVIVFIISIYVALFISMFIYSSIETEFYSTLYSYISDSSYTMTNVLESLIITFPSFEIVILVSFSIGFFIAIFYFFSVISRHSLSLFATLAVQAKGHEREAAYSYHLAYLGFKKDVRKDFLKNSYIGIILLVIGYGVSIFVATLFLDIGDNITQICISGLIGAFIILLFYFPIHADLIEQIYVKYFDDYQQETIKLTRKNLEALAKEKELKEEEIKYINEMLNKVDEAIEEKDSNELDEDGKNLSNDDSESSLNEEEKVADTNEENNDNKQE